MSNTHRVQFCVIVAALAGAVEAAPGVTHSPGASIATPLVAYVPSFEVVQMSGRTAVHGLGWTGDLFFSWLGDPQAAAGATGRSAAVLSQAYFEGDLHRDAGVNSVAGLLIAVQFADDEEQVFAIMEEATSPRNVARTDDGADGCESVHRFPWPPALAACACAGQITACVNDVDTAFNDCLGNCQRRLDDIPIEERTLEDYQAFDACASCCDSKSGQDAFNCVITCGLNGPDDDYAQCLDAFE